MKNKKRAGQTEQKSYAVQIKGQIAEITQAVVTPEGFQCVQLMMDRMRHKLRYINELQEVSYRFLSYVKFVSRGPTAGRIRKIFEVLLRRAPLGQTSISRQEIKDLLRVDDSTLSKLLSVEGRGDKVNGPKSIADWMKEFNGFQEVDHLTLHWVKTTSRDFEVQIHRKE